MPKKTPESERQSGKNKPQKNVSLSNSHAAKPVSLAPLEFEEAVEGLLRVKPSVKDKPPTESK